MKVVYSVIIPAYNEEALLPRTLRLLKNAMTGASLAGEVIVVDNNSSDGTARVAESAGARVVREPVNQISRARNAGARAAQGRFLIFLDADTLPTGELLRAALTCLDNGATGGGAVIELTGDGAPGAFHRVLPLLTWGLMKLDICGGSFIFCRQEAFAEVGGFSEDVYAAEDVILSRALRAWGKRNARPFIVLTDTPIRSSDRKLRSHSPAVLALLLLFFGLFPFAVRFKSLCDFWYRR